MIYNTPNLSQCCYLKYFPTDRRGFQIRISIRPKILYNDLMTLTFALIAAAAFAVLTSLTIIISKSIEDKKAYKIMQSKGVVLARTKENYAERNNIIDTLTLPVRIYINGPDQTSLMSRRKETIYNIIKLPNGAILFDIWVTGYSRKTTRARSTLFVAEFKDSVITHFAKGKDYITHEGNFDAIPNYKFEIADPAKYSVIDKILNKVLSKLGLEIKPPK